MSHHVEAEGHLWQWIAELTFLWPAIDRPNREDAPVLLSLGKDVGAITGPDRLVRTASPVLNDAAVRIKPRHQLVGVGRRPI